MAVAGQFRPVATANSEPPVAEILRQGLALVEDLSQRLQCLDDLLLAGRPNEISDAASSIEDALQAASPAFAEVAETMGRLGASNLAAAAAQLRRIEEEDAAGLAEALRGALTRFSKRSAVANRRAQQLNRGLNAALRSLQALGVQENGRLIAEA
jgi:hypothetical protein